MKPGSEENSHTMKGKNNYFYIHSFSYFVLANIIYKTIMHSYNENISDAGTKNNTILG